MATRKSLRTNGHPVSITPAVGVAPSQVVLNAPSSISTTTFSGSLTPATGTAPITYTGLTSTDGGATYSANSGVFTSTVYAFSGLAPSTAYKWKYVATNLFGSSTTIYSGVTTTTSAAATNYTVAISPASGLSGSSFSYTATPSGGLPWPSGEVITPTVTGGTASPTSATGSGTTPVVFTVAATGSGGTNCIVNSSAPGMTNSTGAESYAITTPSTILANRYDIIPNASSGPSGTGRTITLYPNGVWAGGSLTLAATNGTFSPSATLTLPSSGSVAQTVTWTPSAVGEVTITGTNTGGLHNPLGAYYTCFASSAGTAQTMTANGSYFLDQQPFQQDVWSGTPTGFTAAGGATLGMGWGVFQVKVTPAGASGALYGRLVDSDSTGATSTSGGTAITSITQIYGAVAGGAEITANVNLPSSDYTVYLDVATDSAMTNPARIPLRFRITDVVAIMSRSMECGWIQNYGDPGAPGNLLWSSYTKTMVCASQNPNGTAMPAWQRADGFNSYGWSGMAAGSTGSQEAGRRWLLRKGHGCALAGCVPTGFQTDDFIASDGSPCPGFTDAVSKCNNKFRYLKTLLNEWSGIYATESYAEYQTIYASFVSKMTTLYPALAVMALGTSSGQFGHNGSMRNDAATPNTGSMVGYTRIGKIITDQIEPANPMVASADAAPDWDEWDGTGHATKASKERYVRNGALAMLMADGGHAGGYGLARADRYVTFSGTGTISGDDLRIPFILPTGAAGLVAKKWGNGTTAAGWTYSTPTAAELRNLVSVFPLGQNDATGRPIVLTGVAIDNTNKWLVLTLSRTGGAGTIINFDNTVTSQPSSLTVHLISDFNDYNYDSSSGVGIFDDRTSLDDFGFGPHVRPQLDIVVS